MDELIQRISSAAGIDAGQAQSAVGAILSFLNKEGPSDTMGMLFDNIPGSRELAESSEGGGGGLFGAVGGLFGGGGVLGLGTKLLGMGLSMDQAKAVGSELFAYGREKVGEDSMGQIMGSIPGLSQFL